MNSSSGIRKQTYTDQRQSMILTNTGPLAFVNANYVAEYMLGARAFYDI